MKQATRFITRIPCSRIRSFPHQEIGTHTFSHYYCLEEGQDVAAFKADLRAALETGKKQGIVIESLVFPRNQFNDAYVAACAELGIKAYRGNPSGWAYRPRARRKESLRRRGLRLLDAYVGLSSRNSHSLEPTAAHAPLNIPASRFLRPSQGWRMLDTLRLRRMARRNELCGRERPGLPPLVAPPQFRPTP